MQAAPERHVTTVLACQQCGAALETGAHRTAACPYCASPSVIERPASPDRPAPIFVVPFAGGDDLPRRALTDWVRRQSLFADSALRGARVEDLRGVYVPAYLYSAVARSSFRAEIGENYTETYTTTDAKGNTTTRTRTVTEWRGLAGQHVAYATDVVVSASAGLPNAELEAVEPFDLRLPRRYDAALISGWLAEEPSRDRAECLALARGETSTLAGRQLAAFMPGDSHRGLVYQTTVEWEQLDPILVPIYVLAVRYRPDRPALRVVVNGQTGRAAGKAPLAAWKIVLAVVLGLAALVALVLAFQGAA
jgi:DNA-directed RNA polymerase subunit RPC12/RpoP